LNRFLSAIFPRPIYARFSHRRYEAQRDNS
jgi:hypothetical protein